MKIFLLFCCWSFLLLGACSLPREVTAPDMAGKDPDRPGRLLNIRIERFDSVRFSGLLGVKEKAIGLQYVLLDATGVKLLQAEVAGDGSYKLPKDAGPLVKSGLAPFLSEALARIYLQEPDRLPCTGSWLYRLCREVGDDGSAVKYGQAGPFRSWRITGQGPAGAGDGAVVYHHPWLGVKITLEALAAGK